MGSRPGQIGGVRIPRRPARRPLWTKQEQSLTTVESRGILREQSVHCSLIGRRPSGRGERNPAKVAERQSDVTPKLGESILQQWREILAGAPIGRDTRGGTMSQGGD